MITGKITKARIIRALENSKLSIDEEIDLAEIESAYNVAKEAIALSNISQMTYNQLDAYIDEHVTDLAAARTYLKKLSRVVLAMLKYFHIK